jgi:hypothetical protein
MHSFIHCLLEFVGVEYLGKQKIHIVEKDLG